ncbi:MAG: GGDEF domain-containing protein, partial [Rhodanobacter sp.]
MATDPATIARQDVVDELQRSQTRWSRVDTLLRRLATRLTYAADGRNPRLDGALRALRHDLREPLAEDALQQLLEALTDAVRSLDVDVAAMPGIAPAAATRDSAASVLLALADRLQMDEPGTAELGLIRAAITAATDFSALAPQAEALAELVNRDHRHGVAQQAASEQLLTLVTRQLDELAQYLSRDSADHHDGARARHEMGRHLNHEIDVLGNNVHSASDVSSLQREIQMRLGAITVHLKSYHEREDARARDWQTRSEQMNQRIHELERSAQSMEISLRQEHQLASTDPLTGIANRLVFEQRIAQACQRAAQSGTPTCLLVLDIDHFKRINDRYGHAAGDRALRIVAEQLRDALRPEDLLARYGGEEFAVVLSNVDGEAGKRIAEVLRQCIADTSFRCKGEPVQITLS